MMWMTPAGRALLASPERELHAAPDFFLIARTPGPLRGDLELDVGLPAHQDPAQRLLDQADVQAWQYLAQPAPGPVAGRDDRAQALGGLVDPDDPQFGVEYHHAERGSHEPRPDQRVKGLRRQHPVLSARGHSL
jgi:hypothetical protein